MTSTQIRIGETPPFIGQDFVFCGAVTSTSTKRQRDATPGYMKRSRRKKPLPGKQDPKGDSMSFHREISAMQIPYNRMNSALDWKDPGRVRDTACHVVLAWLDMEAAFIRFVEHTAAGSGSGSRAWRERLILIAINYLIRELFRRALDETRSWTIARDELRALHVVLRWLHERLQLWSMVELPVLRP